MSNYSNYLNDKKCCANNLSKTITGAQGAQGAQGAHGAIGPKGFTGAQGSSTGSQGFQGVTGNIGAQGFQGVAGNIGAQGFQGVTGNIGAQGFQGVTGNIGAQGFQGVTGNIGAQGFQGVTGNIGAQGFQGVTGNIGAQGFQGVTGNIGAQGFQGVTGNIGAQGFQGVTGNIGAQGFQGVTGNIGAQGFQGSTGAQGSTGGTPWITMNGIGTQGSGYTGIGVTGQDVLVYGNLYVSGKIDPTDIILSNNNSTFYTSISYEGNIYINGHSSSRLTFNNGVTTSDITIERLAIFQKIFPAVELPSNNTTLQINNTLLLTDGTNTNSVSNTNMIMTNNTYNQLVKLDNGSNTGVPNLYLQDNNINLSSQLTNGSLIIINNNTNYASTLSDTMCYLIDNNTRNYSQHTSVGLIVYDYPTGNGTLYGCFGMSLSSSNNYTITGVDDFKSLHNIYMGQSTKVEIIKDNIPPYSNYFLNEYNETLFLLPHDYYLTQIEKGNRDGWFCYITNMIDNRVILNSPDKNFIYNDSNGLNNSNSVTINPYKTIRITLVFSPNRSDYYWAVMI